MAHDMTSLMGLVTLTFDLLTLKLVCESHLRRVTFVPNLDTLGLWVLESFAMYATAGQTDRRTDGRTDGWTKAKLTVPFPTGGGIIIIMQVYINVSTHYSGCSALRHCRVNCCCYI